MKKLLLSSILLFAGSAYQPEASINNPNQFAVYANEYNKSNHLEGNMAVGSLNGEVTIWGGKSYIGAINAPFHMNVADGTVVLPEDTEYEVAPGQGFRVRAGDLEFITDNKCNDISTQASISETISNTLAAQLDYSYSLQGPNVESGSRIIEARSIDSMDEEFMRSVAAVAQADRNYIINIVSSNGVINIPDMSYVADTGYHSWASNILWNCGDAVEVNLNGALFGTVLAPKATVRNTNNLVGSVICDKLEQSGEIHQFNWIPKKDEPTPTPTPEIIPEPTPEVTPEPEPTPEPIPEITPTPTPEVVPTPEPTPEVTKPTPTPEVKPTPTTTPAPKKIVTPNTGDDIKLTPLAVILIAVGIICYCIYMRR